jgi:hypothetical protein
MYSMTVVSSKIVYSVRLVRPLTTEEISLSVVVGIGRSYTAISISF